MKKGNLKNVVNEFVEKQSLSKKQLNSLLKLQQNKSEKTSMASNNKIRWAAIAAVLFITFGNVLYFSMLSDIPLAQRIGTEVAKNHINLKPLEIQTSSIKDIRTFLSKLDFIPIESVLLKESSKSLIGGRYCSIQGVRAAQLRLKDSTTGQIQSLYETVYDPNVFSNLPELKEGQKPITVYSKGLAVDIWVEKGLLFALTRETK